MGSYLVPFQARNTRAKEVRRESVRTVPRGYSNGVEWEASATSRLLHATLGVGLNGRKSQRLAGRTPRELVIFCRELVGLILECSKNNQQSHRRIGGVGMADSESVTIA